ncbi:WD40 repeat-like protein [Suillus weaverae]|nr:WD40 repeat-like protein [Suillus weaverae]
MSQLIPSTTPLRTFEDHEGTIKAVAVFPDKRRMVTGSKDKTLRLWDLETGVVLKKMEGHSREVSALTVSRDGQIIASGDEGGVLIAWHGETGESLTQPMEVYSGHWILSLDFSPNGTVLATGHSYDETTKFWCTKTWQMQGEPIEARFVYCVRYSPSGELLAIATILDIQIYNTGTRERVASFTLDGYISFSVSLAWTPDGTRLLSGGSDKDPTIRKWDSLTWQQVGHPWKGHFNDINAIAIHPAGTLVASVASDDNRVRLWRLSDQRTIAIFQHSSPLESVAFSTDGKHILTGGKDNKISEWEILTITRARDACITGDLSTAEELLMQDIRTNVNDYTLYAHRSFIMARKRDWDHALEDAIKSISIQPSLAGYISKGIALCGQGHIREARTAFDVASVFTNQNSESNHFLLLIKAIALFNADQHDEAMLLIKELAAACRTDLLGCRVVETYLRVQLGINAFDGARHGEAADHFTAAVNSGAFSSKFIPQTHEDLTVVCPDGAYTVLFMTECLVQLFGWDLESLCLTAHQKRCKAFLSAGKPDEALEAYQYMMDAIDESAKASCLDWSNGIALAELNDRILGAEIPGQGQEGYDTEPNFFHGMHQHSQISRPRPQQRSGRLKKLRDAMTRTPRSAPPPVPPTAPPPVAAATTFKSHLRHLFTLSPHHATPPVVNVPFAKGKERNAAAGAPGNNPDIVPYEDQDLNTTHVDPNTQQQQQAVAVHIDPDEHGGMAPSPSLATTTPSSQLSDTQSTSFFLAPHDSTGYIGAHEAFHSNLLFLVKAGARMFSVIMGPSADGVTPNQYHSRPTHDQNTPFAPTSSAT